jgi:hypothetical protein
VIGALVAASFGLVPWTLWLTYSLPSRHITRHYDLAWIGFDIVLGGAIALTATAAMRDSHAVVPLAAVTGTMLLCDAWFDVITSAGGGELLEALLLATLAELPLAVMCGLLVWDAHGVFEQAKSVLELGDTQLELVEVVPRDEVQLVDERPHGAERLT